MGAKGSALLAGVCLCVCHCLAYAQINPEAEQAYLQENWQLAIRLLLNQQTDSGAQRMLALAYYQQPDFEKADPALQAALQKFPDDIELNAGYLEVLLAKSSNKEASDVALHLRQLGANEVADFALARIELQDGERTKAKSQLENLVETAEPAIAGRAADVLVEALYADSEFEWAYEVAQTIIRRDPESPLAYRFSWFRPDNATSTGFSTDLGYRFEFDDNVAVPTTDFGSGQEDYRHVLMADVLYERPFGDGWNFYAQGHFLQSLHHDLDQFDQTRLSASAAIGKSGQKMGWRLPIEASHDRLDGDSFRTSVAAVPGIYIQFGEDIFSHFYARIQSDSYEIFFFPEEDRSGDVYGGGVMLAGSISTRIKIHSYLEYNRYDTDGDNWQRDEYAAFVLGEYEFTPKWTAGLALRYASEDFDNVRPVFASTQKDDSKELYLNITHKFARKWRWRGQFSMVKHESNIAIFDFDRNVYSFSVAREF